MTAKSYFPGLLPSWPGYCFFCPVRVHRVQILASARRQCNMLFSNMQLTPPTDHIAAVDDSHTPTEFRLDEAVLTEPEAFELLAHLVSSADVSLSEPRKYPPYRLVDAAGWLAARVADRTEPSRSEFWETLAAEIETNKDLMMFDPPAFERLVHSLVVEVIDEMARRLDVHVQDPGG